MKTRHQKSNLQLYLLMTCIWALYGCQTKISLDDVDSEMVSEVNRSVLTDKNDTLTNIIEGTASQGETWKLMESAFKSCYKDQTFKNPVYLGPSNAKYLGTIFSKDKTETRRLLSSAISPEDLSKLIITGKEVSNCNSQMIKDFAFDFLVSAALGKMDDSLKTAVSNYDSVKVESGKWQIDELVIDDFLDYINSSTSSKVKLYKNSLSKTGNLVITKVVKISGFTGKIYTSRQFGPKLKLQLQEGKLINVISPDSSNNNLSFKLSASSKKQKIINISSDGQCYIFALVKKGKTL